MKSPKSVVVRLGGLAAAVAVGLVTTVVPADAQVNSHRTDTTTVGTTQRDTGWDEP